MNKSHFTVLLMMSLLAPLCGCKPDAPAQQAAPVPAIVAAQPQPPAPSVETKPESKDGITLATTNERELAQKSGCFTCHTIEKKLVGPAWNDVAAKYRGQGDAEAKLISKVAKGGSGTWGSMPMPPNSPRVSDSDIKILVHYILSLK